MSFPSVPSSRCAKTWLYAILFLVTATFVISCGCKPDENSGADKVRGHANKLRLEQVFTDEINPEECDHTDWKRVDIPAKGSLTVTIFWESEEAHTRAGLYDKLGNKLTEKEHHSGSTQDQLVIKVVEDPYFVKIEGIKHRTTYSVQAFWER